MGSSSASVAEIQAIQKSRDGGSPSTGTCNSSPDISAMRSREPFPQPCAASLFQQGRHGGRKWLVQVTPVGPWRRRRSGQERCATQV